MAYHNTKDQISETAYLPIYTSW